ncbi:MAG: hypothetical protein JHC28_00930 [Thermoprotei archaeon]|nr:hypothetical protein [Thermoprotei archaeon]
MKSVISLEISAIRHMTEDEEKVERCIAALLPQEMREKTEIQKSRVKGHYGNEITYMKLNETKSPEKILSYVSGRLDDYSRGILEATIEDRIEENRLHLRFHKHLLLEDKLVLSDSDEVVKVTIVFSSKDSLREFLETMIKRR